MWNDPIVAEVRKSGEELSNESGGDVHVFFSNLRLTQEKYAKCQTTKIPLKVNIFHEPYGLSSNDNY
jgi:hypothetical protein